MHWFLFNQSDKSLILVLDLIVEYIKFHTSKRARTNRHALR